jgi:hypothetical protein
MSVQLPATGPRLRIHGQPGSELNADRRTLDAGSWLLEAVYG